MRYKEVSDNRKGFLNEKAKLLLTKIPLYATKNATGLFGATVLLYGTRKSPLTMSS